MFEVQVMIPFAHKGKAYLPPQKVNLPEETVKTLLGIDSNMVKVLGKVAEPKKAKK